MASISCSKPCAANRTHKCRLQQVIQNNLLEVSRGPVQGVPRIVCPRLDVPKTSALGLRMSPRDILPWGRVSSCPPTPQYMSYFRIDIACLHSMLIPVSVYSVYRGDIGVWDVLHYGRHILECNVPQTFCPRAGCQGEHLQGGHLALPHSDQPNQVHQNICSLHPRRNANLHRQVTNNAD